MITHSNNFWLIDCIWIGGVLLPNELSSSPYLLWNEGEWTSLVWSHICEKIVVLQLCLFLSDTASWKRWGVWQPSLMCAQVFAIYKMNKTAHQNVSLEKGHIIFFQVGKEKKKVGFLISYVQKHSMGSLGPFLPFIFPYTKHTVHLLKFCS